MFTAKMKIMVLLMFTMSFFMPFSVESATVCQIDVNSRSPYAFYSYYRLGVRYTMSAGMYNVDDTWEKIELNGRPVYPGSIQTLRIWSIAQVCGYSSGLVRNYLYIPIYYLTAGTCWEICSLYDACTVYSADVRVDINTCGGDFVVNSENKYYTSCHLNVAFNNICTDNDCDGDSDTLDCDDCNYTISHFGTEICGNAIDEDCSGADLPCFTPSTYMSPQDMITQDSVNKYQSGNRTKGLGGYETCGPVCFE